MCDFLSQCLLEIGLIDDEGNPELSIWAVTDQGSNILRALKLLKEEKIIEGYHPCFNHNVQNVIKEAINATPGMKTSIEAFQRNAAILSKSKNERSAFKKMCTENNVPSNVPQVPNITRWFGQLAMLKTFQKVERGMKLHIADSSNMRPLTATDWKNCRGYVDVLEPFLAATKIEESESVLTLSSVIPALSVLYERTSSYIANRSHAGYGTTLARNLLSAIDDRFGMNQTFFLQKPHCYATLSDPRFSWVYFKKGDARMDQMPETVIEGAKVEIAKIETKTRGKQSAQRGISFSPGR